MSKNIETSQTTTTQVKKERSRFVKFMLMHKGASFFFLLMLVAIVWGWIKISGLQKENTALKSRYEIMLDSVRTVDFALTAKVFSWAVRSDMLRNNYEQATIYADQAVENPHINRIYAVDIKSKKIIISSDEKEVGLPVADLTLLKPKESVIETSEGIKRFITPFAGLNNDIGVLVMEVKLN